MPPDRQAPARRPTNRRAICLLIALAGLALLPLPTAAQTGTDPLPPPHLGYGIHIGPHLPAPQEQLQALGMDWVKVYDAGQVDDYPDLRVLYRMDLDWPDDWDTFQAEVERRTQELVQRGVAAIEVHNEPNLSLEWPRGPDAWEYVQLLRVAYGIIKAVDPNVIVVSAGLAPTLTTPDRAAVDDLEFAREMLENGAADYMDAFGYHPYGFNQPPEADPYQFDLTFRRTERLHALLVEYGGADLPIWLTEFGWLRDPAEGGLDCTGSPALEGFRWFMFDSSTIAVYTVRAFAYADRYWPWVGPMFLWNLNWQMYETDIEDPCSHLRWFGILEPDGAPTATYTAIAAMPHRYSSYLPRLTGQPVFDPSLPVPPINLDGQWMYSLGAYCPRVTRVGEFVIVNGGWPAALNITVEPMSAPTMPEVFVSTPQARFGDRVVIYADVSAIGPGQYLLVVNLRSVYEGRPLSGNVRLLLSVENSAVNCD